MTTTTRNTHRLLETFFLPLVGYGDHDTVYLEEHEGGVKDSHIPWVSVVAWSKTRHSRVGLLHERKLPISRRVNPQPPKKRHPPIQFSPISFVH